MISSSTWRRGTASINDSASDLPGQSPSRPEVREADGLAMSSRNAYLTSVQRQAALCLSRALCKAERLVRRGEVSAAAIVKLVLAEINNEPLATVDYVEICDAETLDVVDEAREPALLALAVRIGKARLIDNRVLKH